MALVTTDATDSEPLDLEAAKRHLRVLTSAHDEEIRSQLAAARDYCERQTSRTLRVDVTRTWTMDEWWCGALVLPWPPLRSITSLKYYDTDGVQQTVNSSNYRTELSTDGFGRLHFVDGFDLPDLATRSDAIELVFVTGYSSAELVPPTAVQAIKTKMTELWGSGPDSELKAAAACAERLLGTVDVTSYV